MKHLYFRVLSMVGLLCVAHMAFGSIELTLTDSFRSAGDTTPTDLGEGSTSAIGVRSRRFTTGQEDLRWVTFFQYDVSSLTTDYVNSPLFAATFEIQFNSDIGGTTIGIGIGRNDGGAWDSSSGTNNPLHNWGFNFGTETVTAADGVIMFNFSSPHPATYTGDVTTIVQDWVNGTEVNNGLVLYYDDNDFTVANISNPKLRVIPEPTSFGLIALAGVSLLYLKRSRRYINK